ncbi:MAG: lipoate--protein ligase [Clostridium sp.]|nr:lipoate--protein ligase [Clostridium sp.]
MIDRLIWMETGNTYPYRNLAVEEYLTGHVPGGACILFLWQNRHTVVIGKNQNCWRECKVDLLEKEGGYLARRLSGGGAVYHDMGNLNFTFIVRRPDYNLGRQLDVIVKAVQMLGIQAEKTGRNDITVEGRKFSGNAFYSRGDCCCHHGTLLLNTDKEKMSRYLNVSGEKLASKGVASVKSRVANLCEYREDVTADKMKSALVRAFSGVYGHAPVKMKEDALLPEEMQKLTERFESWQWKYGRKIPFQYEIGRRFSWGEIQIQMYVNEGMVQDVNVYSDAMEQDLAGELEQALKGCAYGARPLCKAVLGAGACKGEAGAHNQLNIIKGEIAAFIRESLQAAPED